MNAKLKDEILAVLKNGEVNGIDAATLSDEDLRTYITLQALKIESKDVKYEYAVETVRDRDNGGADESSLADVLSMYGERGWRLKFCFTDEMRVERDAEADATINDIVLIFERKI
jgi:hypothetical protein